MYWISIEQIKCFQAVIEEGSFSKASERLNKAKSAVIYSVNTLEEQLGFSLIERSQYRPSLTDQGVEFLKSADRFLNNYHDLQKSIGQIADHIESRLAISVSDIYRMDRLYPIIKKAMKKYPQTEIILEREILSGEKMLLNGQVDIAIFENLKAKKLINFQEFDEVEFKLVLASNHEFLDLKKSEQTDEKLKCFPHIIQRSTIVDDDIQIGIDDNEIKWKVTDTSSKKEIILNGLGWGRLPNHVCKHELKQKKLIHLEKFDSDDTAKIYVGHLKSKSLGKVAQFIWDQLTL